ncbi:MAG TPA: MraY family glycosyltransferase [Steroidobacteraceae bacterium]|nr:MraY family glycosyltransferase [Steroidobacteraceae bacterium]
MQLLVAFMIALAITMLLVPPLGRLASGLKLLDRPNSRKIHSAPVPRIGGAAMVLGVCAALLLTVQDEQALPAYLVGVVVLLIAGVLDDRFDLDYRLKLAGQALAATVAIAMGDFRIESISFSERLMLPEWISLPLTFLFIIGVTNAINLADGLDGLAGGTSLLCAVALTAFGFVADNTLVALSGAALAGALLGFLRFNTHPARVFMGDGGSQFLGFSVAILAIDATQRDSAYSAALPLLLLAWPILDTLAVMTTRILAGDSPFAADRRHLHHRLLALGFGHRGAVYVVYAVQVALFLIAYFMRFENDTLIVAAFVTFAFVVLGSVRWLEMHHWSVENSAGARSPPLPTSPRVQILANWAMGGSAVAYAMIVAAGTAPVSTDIGYLAAALLIGQLLISALPGHTRLAATQRAIAYVTAVVAVFLDHRGLGAATTLSVPVMSCFIILAFVVVASFRLSGGRRFELTTLDLLVIFVAIVVPSLPGIFGDASLVGATLAKVVVLFYALEFLLNAAPARRPMQAAIALFLTAIAWRSLAAYTA